MDGSDRSLSRRAFVRGAVLTSVAAAAAAARPLHGAIASATDTVDGVPQLVVHDPVTGVAARAGRLLAVGGHVTAPRAWSLPPDGVAWETVAGDGAFPEATSLRDVTAHSTGFLATGCRESSEGPRPAVFASADGASWVGASLPEIGHGVGQVVASKDGATLVVGTTFDEPDVREPVRTVAFASDVAGAWSAVPLEGVRKPQHGATTMLAATRAAFLLATVDVGGSALYASTSARGPWRQVPAPRTDETVSFLAAADTDGGVLLAGVDVLDRPRFWLQGSRGWRETPAPSGLTLSSHVVGFARTDEALVAAGSDGSGSFVEEVTAA